jgi:hypothetical protein
MPKNILHLDIYDEAMKKAKERAATEGEAVAINGLK